MNAQIIGGVLIPFLGTSLGAGMVFFLKKQISSGTQKALTGFAAGGISSVLFAKKKIKAKVEKQALKQIEESHDLAQQSVNRACKALDKLTEKAKKLEEAVTEYDIRKSAKMEVR